VKLVTVKTTDAHGSSPVKLVPVMRQPWRRDTVVEREAGNGGRGRTVTLKLSTVDDYSRMIRYGKLPTVAGRWPGW
jgi:hypothetical protein